MTKDPSKASVSASFSPTASGACRFGVSEPDQVSVPAPVSTRRGRCLITLPPACHGLLLLLRLSSLVGLPPLTRRDFSARGRRHSSAVVTIGCRPRAPSNPDLSPVFLQYFSMIELVPNNDVLEKCIKDILSQIKPAEDDLNRRLSAIKELEVSMQPVAALKGAAAKPFGSFLSNLYSKSGDLDISVQLMNGSNLPINKKKKISTLKAVRTALQKGGVYGYMEFIPQARVPVLQYVSNRFGISCDLSVDNYPGRIKSKIFYWISTLDERFGDMVLLIKEWAKAQNINDPKSGTLNSYSLCLLVLFHFQTCEPAILPPLEDIYEGNITEDFADMTLYNEEHLDEVCAANIAKFQSQNKEQRNESSLCHLLATFFHKFCHIDSLSSDVISTYTGQFKKIQDIPIRRKKSYSLFVEDPVERPDNAARAIIILIMNEILLHTHDRVALRLHGLLLVYKKPLRRRHDRGGLSPLLRPVCLGVGDPIPLPPRCRRLLDLSRRRLIGSGDSPSSRSFLQVRM
ncbi:hypothetical protein ZWY2020_030971 [Hordeum vulgare]|nr:hypothetical protein ZWY2020_030971 [Hordeum vulgare]